MFEFHLGVEQDNVNVHRAAAKVLQAKKPARPAIPCASYCYPAREFKYEVQRLAFSRVEKNFFGCSPVEAQTSPVLHDESRAPTIESPC